jgi:hypothetical protein
MLPEVFVPWRQALVWSRSLTLVARSTGPAGRRVPVLTQRLLAIDPAIPADVQPLANRASRMVAPRRFTMAVLSGFALLALTLAAIGVYGVLSFSVAQRTRELAVRLALGADPGRLLRSVVGDGIRAVGAGMAAGLAGALLLGSMVRSLVFGVSPREPAVLAAGFLVVAAAGMLAAWQPARRAARVAPMEVLRSD